MRHVAERYFVRANYLRVDGGAYFSIFDSTFFCAELGGDGVREAITRARDMLRATGLPAIHLAAIEPNEDWLPHVRELGFDSVTNYVFLPDWKGAFLQDYAACAEAPRRAEWPGDRDARAAGRPYHPSVSPGWDASPRGADFGPARPDKYPWSPVVVGEHPDKFRAAVARAVAFARATSPASSRFIASLNENGARVTTSSQTRGSALAGSRRCATVARDGYARDASRANHFAARWWCSLRAPSTACRERRRTCVAAGMHAVRSACRAPFGPSP